MDREARHLLVSGEVQGVGYRAWTQRTAAELGLHGWVRNLHDGRVEIYAEGTPEQLARFVEKCRRGPHHARVSDVAEAPARVQDTGSFAVRGSAGSPSS